VYSQLQPGIPTCSANALLCASLHQLNVLWSILYVELEGKYAGYALTSNGRMINLKSGNQTSAYFKKDHIVVPVRDIRMDLATEFMKYGWSFDKDEIKRLYDENKWKYLWGLNRVNYTK